MNNVDSFLNFDLLWAVEKYDGQELRSCKLCGEGEELGHTTNCPAYFLDALTYEIHVSGVNPVTGARQTAFYAGANLADIAREIVRTCTLQARTYTARAVLDMGDATETLRNAAWAMQLQQEREEREAARTRLIGGRFSERAAALARLEADKPDLSAEGYARRKAQLHALYGAQPELTNTEEDT